MPSMWASRRWVPPLARETPAQLGSPRIGRLNMTVFESLTVSARTAILEPRLATWEVSDDGLTWTFFLERGVQFHRGYGEMTAEDVTWSWIPLYR